MKKAMTTLLMTILFVWCLALGVQLGIRNIRIQEERVIVRYVERQEQNCRRHFTYDCTIEKEPSVPFFFRIFYNSYNRLKIRR